MSKQSYRYFDTNLVRRKSSDCDGCLIDNNGQPSLNLYQYIHKVLQEDDCCGVQIDDPCPKCDDYFIDKTLFVKYPFQKNTQVENFDLHGIIICVLTNECAKVIDSPLYNKYCICESCCPKEYHIPCYRLKKKKRTEKCVSKVQHGQLISLYNLIKEIANIYCNA